MKSAKARRGKDPAPLIWAHRSKAPPRSRPSKATIVNMILMILATFNPRFLTMTKGANGSLHRAVYTSRTCWRKLLASIAAIKSWLNAGLAIRLKWKCPFVPATSLEGSGSACLCSWAILDSHQQGHGSPLNSSASSPPRSSPKELRQSSGSHGRGMVNRVDTGSSRVC